MQALATDQEKLNAFNQEAPGITKVFIVGMPSEIGVRAMDGRAGAERGPESFRELLTLCALPSNPVSSSTSLLDSIKIYDCGNIEVNQGQASEHKDLSRDTAGAKLADLTFFILSRIERSKVFVIGGSDEMTFNLMEALNKVD